MATYSEKDFNTSHYNDARPNYPHGFYETLMQYHDNNDINDRELPSRELAIDVGCGSGFVTFKLLEFFKSVLGTDISGTMIQQCNKDKRVINNNRIQFLEASAENPPSSVKDNTMDLITGAECCHWVDHDIFFKQCWRILKPGGTLAYWFYKDPIFVDYPEANDIYNEYCYDHPDYMGPCYEQPGRNYLKTLLREIQVPQDLYTDIIRREYEPLREGDTPTSLYISKKITLADFKDYVTSWSAYHNWKKKYPNAKEDIADKFIAELQKVMKIDNGVEFTVVWGTVYTFARKR